jgi:hypothetical protein
MPGPAGGKTQSKQIPLRIRESDRFFLPEAAGAVGKNAFFLTRFDSPK